MYEHVCVRACVCMSCIHRKFIGSNLNLRHIIKLSLTFPDAFSDHLRGPIHKIVVNICIYW